MFHVSWNVEKGGTSAPGLVQALEAAVRSVMPSGWSVSVDQDTRGIGSRRADRPDALLVIVAPDGNRSVVLVECKGVVVPRDIAAIARQLRHYTGGDSPEGLVIAGALLATPFISPTMRAHLVEHGLGWFDPTGNLRLALNDPVVFLDRAGAERSGFRDPADSRLKSLRGPAAAKIVLELCDTSLPVGVRDLAARAQVGAGTSARVLDLLDRDAVVVRSPEGAVTDVHRRRLIERWALDYNVAESNDVIATIDPRGLSHAMKSLASAPTEVAVTGSLAARAYLPEHLVPVAPLVSLDLYAVDPGELMDQWGLTAVDRGVNVVVMRAYDDVVHARSRVLNGVRYAPPGQVLADLLTGPGRASEEAEQLMSVLESTESAWGK